MIKFLKKFFKEHENEEIEQETISVDTSKETEILNQLIKLTDRDDVKWTYNNVDGYWTKYVIELNGNIYELKRFNSSFSVFGFYVDEIPFNYVSLENIKNAIFSNYERQIEVRKIERLELNKKKIEDIYEKITKEK